MRVAEKLQVESEVAAADLKCKYSVGAARINPSTSCPFCEVTGLSQIRTLLMQAELGRGGVVRACGQAGGTMRGLGESACVLRRGS